MLVTITRVKCDRCGAASGDHDTPRSMQAWERFTRSAYAPVLDLCPHCAMAFNAWWKHPSAGEPKEVTADDKL